MTRTHALLVLALITPGCAAHRTASVAPLGVAGVGDATEYARFRGAGTLTLSGQAFLTTRGGDVKLAAGRQVTLDPGTTYARAWFHRFGADLERFDEVPMDSLFRQARRVTTADAQGQFRFSRLTPGDYLVRTTVTWETGAAYSGLQGGVLASFITLADTEPSPLILNQVVTQETLAIASLVIIPTGQQPSRPFRSIRRVEGLSCLFEPGDPPPTEQQARQNLVLRAARLGADAVSGVTCEPKGRSLVPTCVRRIVCAGDAIAWR